MTDVRDKLAALASDAGKEILRLGRLDIVDARDELRRRVWPFLVEVIDTLQANNEEGDDPAATIPVDVVARAVGLVLSMANRLGELLPASEMDRFAIPAAEVTEDLMALCDPDELAAFIQDAGPQSDEEEIEARGNEVIDTTIVELAPGPDAATPVDEQTGS